ncbi:hypothetical protein GCM10007425_19120 [Lysinibacillus alkalisoli]|uniref:DUF1871 family protein n=2 Tax=Lysinibacillus alkalisoli TaxID=1911548 RepID=A0A917G5X9_9BACI|nr:hypothetical protein GCM10007425_19120 [Lysinibacillus alkalisoli]
MNRTAVQLVQQWDPFQLGEGEYDTEAADIVAALQAMDDPSDLGKRIQEVFEYSFEQWLPLEDCVTLAYKLIAVKFEAKCII